MLTDLGFGVANWHIIYNEAIYLSKIYKWTTTILDSNSPFFLGHGLLQIVLYPNKCLFISFIFLLKHKTRNKMSYFKQL